MFLVRKKECLRRWGGEGRGGGWGKKNTKAGGGGAEKGQKVSTDSNHQPAKNKRNIILFYLDTLDIKEGRCVRGTGLS